ncbi:hypothetical protein DFJ73DRAFT_849073 [Zopfochytrium polystomum]|nr:hypothetical protein DFJ73DRAFT_849073 [Zopfochytrium polystomum]
MLKRKIRMESTLQRHSHEGNPGRIELSCLFLPTRLTHSALSTSRISSITMSKATIFSNTANRSVALGDFGLTRTISSLSTTSTTQSKGALNWCLPEQLSGPQSQLTVKTDTWSFGMTIVELLKDENPYGDYMDARSAIVADRPTISTADSIPSQLLFPVNLALNRCKKRPDDRISDDEIVSCISEG